MIVHHSIEFSLFVFLAGVILGVVIVFMEDGLPKRKEVSLLCRILLLYTVWVAVVPFDLVRKFFTRKGKIEAVRDEISRNQLMVLIIILIGTYLILLKSKDQAATAAIAMEELAAGSDQTISSYQSPARRLVDVVEEIIQPRLLRWIQN